jgi:hypothetical protein
MSHTPLTFYVFYFYVMQTVTASEKRKRNHDKEMFQHLQQYIEQHGGDVLVEKKTNGRRIYMLANVDSNTTLLILLGLLCNV